MLGVPKATCFTGKVFRAGKATALAAAGASVGEILLAGEWKSRAFLRYVDEDAVDAAQLLESMLDGSDSE